jgi:pimeloyl-ACP methyl ester carboxylesterase
MVVPESGHFVPEEQPQALAERLLRFFAQAV